MFSVMAGQDHLSLFDVADDPNLINGLRQISDLHNHSTGKEPSDEEKDPGPGEKVGVAWGEVSERKQCSACQCCFESREEQMEHYKLDWHRFNLRQRLAGRPPLGADEFESKTGTGDVSSISGSDSEDNDSYSDDDITKDEDDDDDDDVGVNGGGCLSSRVLFQTVQGQYLCVYRCAVHNRTLDADGNLMDHLLKISRQTVWVILMTGGGHFAGAVYQGKEVLQHKTFHRYTVRAKRGTAQSVRDGRGHAPKSAGSALRRYNEAALTKDIQELLKDWTEYLEQAAAIFIRTPKYNRGVFFGGRGAPLGKKDSRIRTVPFATRRATFREVTRVHGVLSGVQVYDASTDVAHLLSPCKRVWHKKPSNQTTWPSAGKPEEGQQEEEEKEKEEEEGSVDLEVVDVTLSTLDLKEYDVKVRRRKQRKRNHRSRPAEKETGNDVMEPQQGLGKSAPWEFSLRDVLYTACKTGDVETLGTVLQREGDALQRLFNTPIDPAGSTLLHVASSAAQKHAVHLLLETGSDPACRDKKGQTPYAVTPDKETRNTFRKFMAENPDKYNYAKAQVPAPLGAEITTKKAEKKKAQKSAKKQREKEQKEQRLKEELEQEEKRRFLQLSDREKRALAAERRLAKQAAVSGSALSNISRCWKCGESLLGKVPFHYLEFSFCSTSCVQAHRKSSSTAKS